MSDHARWTEAIGSWLGRLGRPRDPDGGLAGGVRSKALADQALQHLQNGRLAQSEALYRRLIRSRQATPIVLSNLAAICQMGGRHAEAIPLLRQALVQWPDHPEAHFNLGISLQALADWKGAEQAYRDALRCRPDYSDAWCNLGNLLAAQGAMDAAITAYGEGLRLNPDRADLICNLAICQQQSGALSEAVASYRRAIALQPDLPEPHANLALALKEQRDLAGAVAALEQALRLRPAYPEALANLGLILYQQGELQAAVDACRQALELRPHYPEAWSNLGMVLNELNELEAAVEAQQRALEQDPGSTQALLNLGAVYVKQEQFTAARRCYEQVLERDPAHAEAHFNLGTVLLQQGDSDQAQLAYEQALALQPCYPAAAINLGNLLLDKGDPDAARSRYRIAIGQDPEASEAHYNLGTVQLEQACMAEAIRSLRQAVALRPDHAEAHCNLAFALLTEGQYAEGWLEHEWRVHGRETRQLIARPARPPWVLDQPEALEKLDAAAGREGLLLVCEQGLGDTVQFMRYLKPLQERGVSIRLCAQPALQGLIASNSAGVALCSVEEAQELRDGVWMPLLSLPGLLGVRPEHPLVTAPYIRAEPERVQGWRRRLGEAGGPVVALHWQGNPAAETRNLRGRSLPLASLAPLAAVDVRLLSVQKGAGSEQLECCPFRERFVAAQEEVEGIWDFEETAAIVASTDLLITTDSAVAHLAGAMGHPTWLLLQKTPDWRWGLTGESTFWYPSVRLFRQRERGHWGEVIERVADALQRFTPAPPAPPCG